MLRFKAIVPMCLAVMGMLAGGLVMSPQAKAQEEPKPKTITITGIAVLPDGGAAANLPVAIKVQPLSAEGHQGANGPPDMLSQPGGFKTLAKGVTDAAGRFSIKFNPQDGAVVQLEIGDRVKSAWIIKPVKHGGKDVDLGK